MSSKRLFRILNLFTHLESTSTHSVIANDVAIDGTLRFTGAVHLEGRFTGKIESTGSLYLGPDAVVDAEISVSDLIVMGQLKGSAHVSRYVELRSTACVSGMIEAPKMTIDTGAVFEGEYRRTAHPISDSTYLPGLL